MREVRSSSCPRPNRTAFVESSRSSVAQRYAPLRVRQLDGMVATKRANASESSRRRALNSRGVSVVLSRCKPRKVSLRRVSERALHTDSTALRAVAGFDSRSYVRAVIERSVTRIRRFLFERSSERIFHMDLRSVACVHFRTADPRAVTRCTRAPRLPLCHRESLGAYVPEWWSTSCGPPDGVHPSQK
jgi:hypothetical protein